MNEEVRKKLEELAGNYAEATHGFRPHKYTEAAFMAGAQAGYALGVKAERERIGNEFRSKCLNKGVLAEIPKEVFDSILNPAGDV